MAFCVFLRSHRVHVNIEEIREYCLAKLAVTEGSPFNETTLGFKVMNKMVALTGLEGYPARLSYEQGPVKPGIFYGQCMGQPGSRAHRP